MFNKYTKSPFILATAAGVAVVAADMIWLTCELLVHVGVIDPETYVYIRLCILLALSTGAVVGILAIKVYITDSYLKIDHIQHIKSCIEKRSQEKRNKIMKG